MGGLTIERILRKVLKSSEAYHVEAFFEGESLAQGGSQNGSADEF